MLDLAGLQLTSVVLVTKRAVSPGGWVGLQHLVCRQTTLAAIPTGQKMLSVWLTMEVLLTVVILNTGTSIPTAWLRTDEDEGQHAVDVQSRLDSKHTLDVWSRDHAAAKHYGQLG